MKKKEIWKDIVGYEKQYQISNHGRIKSLQRITLDKWKRKHFVKEKILSGFLNGSNYYSVDFRKGKFNRKVLTIHYLVAKHFINNSKNKPQINHIDGNKHNNYYENLEWCTQKENSIHVYQTGLGSNDWHNKAVSVYDKNNNLIKQFNSYKEAAKWRNIDPSNISNYVKKIQNDSNGYFWKLN